MRRLIVLALLLAMVITLALPGYALEEPLILTDASAQAGDTVYLTVKLTEGVVGDTMGITYSYDTSVLKALPDSCTWGPNGILKDFDENDAGVWAGNAAVKLQDDICVLAFQVLPEVAFTSTKVSCELIVKNGAELVGEYTAEAVISMSCSHTYGVWADKGTLGHSRSCEICGGSQTQSHSWDSGVVSENPDNSNSNLKTYTCTVCGGTYVVEINAQDDMYSDVPPANTGPAATDPAFETTPGETMPQPEYAPERPNSQGTGGKPNGSENNQSGKENQQASGNQSNQGTGGSNYTDYNQPVDETEEDNSHDHSNDKENDEHYVSPDSEDYPFQDHSNEDNSSETAVGSEDAESGEIYEHDHDTTLETADPDQVKINAVLLLVIVAVGVAAARYYLKKKH